MTELGEDNIVCNCKIRFLNVNLIQLNLVQFNLDDLKLSWVGMKVLAIAVKIKIKTKRS